MPLLTITENVSVCVICLKTSPNVYHLAPLMLHHLHGRERRTLKLMQILEFPGSYMTVYQTATSIQNITELGQEFLLQVSCGLIHISCFSWNRLWHNLALLFMGVPPGLVNTLIWMLMSYKWYWCFKNWYRVLWIHKKAHLPHHHPGPC